MEIREGEVTDGTETEEETGLQAVPELEPPDDEEDGQIFDLNQVVSKIKAHKTAEIEQMKLGEEKVLTVTLQCVGMGIELKTDGGWEQVQQFKILGMREVDEEGT